MPQILSWAALVYLLLMKAARILNVLLAVEITSMRAGCGARNTQTLNLCSQMFSSVKRTTIDESPLAWESAAAKKGLSAVSFSFVPSPPTELQALPSPCFLSSDFYFRPWTERGGPTVSRSVKNIYWNYQSIISFAISVLMVRFLSVQQHSLAELKGCSRVNPNAHFNTIILIIRGDNLTWGHFFLLTMN